MHSIISVEAPFPPPSQGAPRRSRDQEGLALRLAVDGGISTETVGLVAAAGADFIVAGTAVIRSGNYAHALANLEQIARDAMPSRQPIQTP